MMGKKAHNLHLLKSAGFEVPNGFVVNLYEKNNNFTDAIAAIGGYPVAVRSSGELEDLGGSSFAGQYETYLGVNSDEMLTECINKCFDSAKSERIKKYIQEKNINATEQELQTNMSVFVQQMVAAKYAGVMFSINPMSGREEEILVELCNGLGEKLVSGLVNPSQYVINNKDYTYEYQEGDEVVALTDNMINDLATKSLEIQAFFNHPQDVEFAFDQNDKLLLLQSRPVTFIKWRDDSDEFTNADLKDGGVSSKVCTPMMFSLYRNTFNDTLEVYLRKTNILTKEITTPWIIHRYGIAYWNSGILKRSLVKIPGFDERKFDEDLGIQKDYGKQGPAKTKMNPKSLMAAIPVLLGLNKEYKECQRMIEQTKEEYDAIDFQYKENLRHLDSWSLEELKSNFFRMYYDHFRKYENSYFRTIYNNSNCQTEFKEKAAGLKKILGYDIDVLKLFIGIGNISHIEIQKNIFDLVTLGHDTGIDDTWNDKFNRFIQKHYHHSDSELDITVPRWIESPAQQKSRILEMIHSDKGLFDANVSEEKQKQEFETYLKQIQKDLIDNSIFGASKFKSFKRKLDQVRYFLLNREKLREFSTRGYYLIRIYLLGLSKKMAAKGLLKEVDDIFFFDINHVLNWCSGKTELDPDISYEKLMYQGYSNFSPPNEFGRGIKETKSERNEHGCYSGIGCSPGTYEGTARVVLDLNDVGRIKNGDILITKFTDPGWTPTLATVGAVVTEVGGVLSHAAVIGREYGIPAVLNISNITNYVTDGQKIQVNGSTGEVTILE